MIYQKYYGFIYKWTDSTNNKTYTGSHYGSVSDRYIGSGTYFLNAYNQRPDKFTREILEYITEDNRKILLETEQKYLDKIDWSNTYNLVPSAGGGSVKGIPMSEEQKLKISEANKGQIPWNKGLKTGPRLEETKKKIGDGNRGKIISEESKKKMSKPKSEETKRKMSQSHKGKVSQNKGKSMSEEQKLKISESSKGRISPIIGKKRIYRTNGSYYME